jgi:hypothetical protein
MFARKGRRPLGTLLEENVNLVEMKMWKRAGRLSSCLTMPVAAFRRVTG